MRFYFGVAAKEDEYLIRELAKIREDVGICVSAYYYKTRKAARKIVHNLKGSVPIILDNGQIQAYRHNQLFKEEVYRNIINQIDPEFSFAPDVIGNPEGTIQSLLHFMKNNDDVDLLAPLQAHNNGLLFKEKLIEEVNILKDYGYEKFGIGKPYEIRFSRPETLAQFVPLIREQAPYVHFMGFPIGRGKAGLNLLDSVDVGTFWTLKYYRVGIYKHPKEGATLLSALMDVDLAVKELHNKKKDFVAMIVPKDFQLQQNEKEGNK